MIDSFFRALASPWVPWLLCALIVGTASLLWYDFKARRMAPVLRGLDDALAALEESQGQSGFKRRFPVVFKRLADNPVVGELWRAYAATLAPAPTSADALGYSRRPHENFNDDLLAHAGVNLRFYNAVPNLLVGCGLLFTFLGLVAALYFASRGVAAAEVEEAQRALRELLHAATFKFMTSIAGLGSSMVFSWREKALLYAFHRKVARFCTALEERMVPVTPESLAAAQLAEMRLQSGELQKLGRSLLVRVPETIEEQLAGELAEAIAPLRGALATAAGRLATIDEWLLDLVLDAAQPPAAEPGRDPGERAGRVLERLDELVGAVRDLRGGPPTTAAPAVAPAPPRADLPDLLATTPELMRSLDGRLGQILGRVREAMATFGREQQPKRAEIDGVARLLMEAQGALQQARTALGQLMRQLEGVVREGRALGSAGAHESFGGALESLGQDLRQTMQVLESGAGAAAERLAQAAGRLEAASGGRR